MKSAEYDREFSDAVQFTLFHNVKREVVLDESHVTVNPPLGVILMCLRKKLLDILRCDGCSTAGLRLSCPFLHKRRDVVVRV